MVRLRPAVAADGRLDGGSVVIQTLNVMQWGDPAAKKVAVGLHGITANGGAFFRPARWLAQRGWRVIAPDMRGHGESGRGDGDFSVAALLADIAAAVPTAPDALIGHSFGGYLAQMGVLEGLFRPGALVLEDPVSHFADKQAPAAMLAWDEANLPRDIEGLMKLNPKWSRLDATWKLLSLEQIDFKDATAAFAGNAPWDLRPRAAEIAAKQPTAWALPEVSRFVPPEDQARLKREVGEEAVVVFPNVGHSIHRDAPEAFVDLVVRLSDKRP
jgi:pimeloyl-ACP methyl ester carboxylesterase